MTETTVFKSNRSQAVRLPKAVALPDEVKRVEAIRMGQTRLIVPIGHGWDDVFDGSGVTDDFMTERDQPEMQSEESRRGRRSYNGASPVGGPPPGR